MTSLGQEIISLFGEARLSVLVVAPFVRSEALYKLLDNIPQGVKVVVVTRWRPADIVAGASDLGVFDLVQSSEAEMYLRNDLHAKMFANDEKCLIGSANVTLTALGWREPSNLELLTPVVRSLPHIVEFERELIAGSVLATQAKREHLEKVIEVFGEVDDVRSTFHDEGSTEGQLPPNWIPICRNPEELHSVYSDGSDFSRPILTVMRQELRQLGIIPGLDEGGFRTWIAAAIVQTPLVNNVIARVESQGHVSEQWLRDLLSELGVDSKERRPRDVMETLKRWLSYFLQMKYQTAQDSIKLIRARTI